MKISLSICLLLGLLAFTAMAKPFPQDNDDEDRPSEKAGEKVDDKNDEVDAKEDEDVDEDANELGEAVSQVLGGLFEIFNQAVKAAGDIATNDEIRKTIGDVVDVGLKTAADGTKAVVDIAADAPKIVEDNINLVDGLAKTVADTSGFIGGTLEELEQSAKLISVFTEAYANVTVKRIDNFLKIFNKRLKCNTECKKLEEGTNERTKCDIEFCAGFEPPKTRKQLEEERLKFVEEYQYDYDYSEEEEDDDDV